MPLYPFMHLFLVTLFTSTIMALSSHQWIMVWLALELNMISFIPLISSSSWFQESEASLKYLLFQALGSSLLLLGAINQTLPFLMPVGLSMKLGTAPFHFWFPAVMKSISWASALLLLTWQKITPMILLSLSFSTHTPLLMVLGTTSAVVGSLGGMIQSQFRPMLAYSSIGHMGWMLSMAPFSPSISLLYLFTYIMISIPIVWSSMLSKIESAKKSGPTNTMTLFILFPLIISLSGIPPLTGFFPKLLILMFLPTLMLVLPLLISSVINLSFYMNFFLTLFLSPTFTKKSNISIYTPLPLSLLALFALLPLPVLLFLFPLL